MTISEAVRIKAGLNRRCMLIVICISFVVLLMSGVAAAAEDKAPEDGVVDPIGDAGNSAVIYDSSNGTPASNGKKV